MKRIGSTLSVYTKQSPFPFSPSATQGSRQTTKETANRRTVLSSALYRLLRSTHSIPFSLPPLYSKRRYSVRLRISLSAGALLERPSPSHSLYFASQAEAAGLPTLRHNRRLSWGIDFAYTVPRVICVQRAP